MLDILYRVRYMAGWIVLVVAAAAILYWGFIHERRAPVLRVGVVEGRALEASFMESLERIVARDTDHRVELIRTNDAAETRKLIKQRELDIGVFDAAGPHLSGLAAIMPLWDRYLQVLVANDSGLESVRDLQDNKVWIGQPDSAMRTHAQRLLDFYGLGKDAIDAVGGPLGKRVRAGKVDAAVVTRNPRDQVLRRAMRPGALSGVSDPGFEGFVYNHRDYSLRAIPAGAYSTADGPQPASGYAVPAALAVLATRVGLPSDSVEALLQAASAPELRSSLTYVGDRSEPIGDTGWSDLTQHPAARGLFGDSDRGLGAASLGRGLSEHWGWWVALAVVVVAALVHLRRHYLERRRREQTSARREIERQFEALIEVERSVREARDARVLNDKMRELNDTKAKVLQVALGSEVAESGLFLAFLEQVRSVSAEIEWRMSLGSGEGDGASTSYARSR